MQKQTAVAILGGTGYGAGELLRLFAMHPEVEVVSVVSSSQGGVPIADAHPHLRSIYRQTFDAQLNLEALSQRQRAVVFAALPHGVTTETVLSLLPELEKRGILLIDLSGDFRLKDRTVREKFYPETSRAPELPDRFVYGLSELNREAIRSARLVSNPGCLATACILAASPFVDAGFSGSIVFDAKTGSSGAGRSLQENFHHPKRNANFSAYKMLSHRHEPEILQGLGDVHGKRIESAFVPHLIPSARGIFVTAYFTLQEEVRTKDLLQHASQYYQGSPFVRIVSDSPELQAVIGSNFCDISVQRRGDQVVVMAALDNLGKGMAGQAIQNMNLMLGLPEETGVWVPGMGPI